MASHSIVHILLHALELVWRLSDLAQASLVVLALGGEHRQFVLKILQSFLDRLLASIALLISCLQIACQDLTVFGKGLQLLVFSSESSLKL